MGPPNAASFLEQSGTETRWTVEGSGLQVRVLVAPICGRRAPVALVVRTGGADEPAPLRQFLDGLRSSGGGNPPYCRELE